MSKAKVRCMMGMICNFYSKGKQNSLYLNCVMILLSFSDLTQILKLYQKITHFFEVVDNKADCLSQYRR